MTMRFHADCAFHIGAQHLRTGVCCQDYAVANAVGDRAWAVVSDGCSTGGRTDVGARLTGLAAARALRVGYSLRPMDYMFHASEFDLVESDFFATCLTAAVSSDKADLCIKGDGVMAVQTDEGLYITRIDWAQNMPCYPSYVVGGYKTFTAAQGGHDALACHVYETRPNVSSLEHIPVSDAVDGYSLSWRRPFKAVAVFSDGVTQVDGVPWKQVVRDLMSFKSIEGDFVKRRLNRFLRDAEKVGRGPIDDIAMAAIVVENEP